MIKSMYIHIPFCKSICSYCDFCKMFYNKKIVDKYLASLEEEIKLKYNNQEMDTIYIGGGSPSSLDIDELKRLFSILNNIKLSGNYEFTFEMNLSDIDEEKLIYLKKNNVNRLSIGVESVNSKYFKFLNRYSTKELVIEKINLVKKYFSNFNIDLMYAFNGQSLEEVLDDLTFIESLNPPHISIYSLIIEEHTKIFIDNVKSIDDELESKMYYSIISFLEKKGYIHYEISNFSKSGYESRHNLSYWNNLEYFGFGLGASGYINGIRYTNTRSIDKYIKGFYVLEKEKITKKVDMENEMIFGLRKIKGVNKNNFFNKFNTSIYDIFDIIGLVENKLLIDENGYIFIPKDKLYVSNSILVNFLGGSNE